MSLFDDISLILFLFCNVVDKIELYPVRKSIPVQRCQSVLKGITSQQPGVEMSNNRQFVGGVDGGDGVGRHHFLPLSGIFDHKLNVS